MKYVRFMGLAVFSRFPISSSVKLGRLFKGALKVTIGHSERKATIVTLHLDHLSETVRYGQVAQLLSTGFLDNVTLIAGDFNALYESDYSNGRWKQINGARLCASLEPATSKVMNLLKEKGWKIPQYTGATTPYGTRVDYVLGASQSEVVATQELTDHNMVIGTITS